MTKEAKDLAEIITKANGGCVVFNLTKASKIAGRCRTNFPSWLNDHGIMIEKTGKDKLVSVNDLAIAITTDRTSPI